MGANNHRLRVVYAVGPGDVVEAYRSWRRQEDTPTEMSIPFSALFLDWCEQFNVFAHLISSHPRCDLLNDGRYTLENRPRSSWYARAGARHYLGWAAYGGSIVATALQNRADVLLVDSGTLPWIELAIARPLRLTVIAVMHNALWPAGFPPRGRVDRFLLQLDKIFFRVGADAIVAISPEVVRQVRCLTASTRGSLYEMRAQYRREFFQPLVPPPPHNESPFRVVFIGRIEDNKGVFLILDAAAALERWRPARFARRIFGAGTAADELTRQIHDRHLDGIVNFEGYLRREDAAAVYAWAHAAVAPTTSGFSEGFCMSVAEAALMGRPLIISSVVPAGELLGDAAISIPADDSGGLERRGQPARRRLGFYAARQAATAAAGVEFYDTSRGLGAVLGRAIAAVMARRRAASSIPSAEYCEKSGLSEPVFRAPAYRRGILLQRGL